MDTDTRKYVHAREKVNPLFSESKESKEIYFFE